MFTARYSSKHFACWALFDPHNYPMRYTLLYLHSPSHETEDEAERN